MTDQERTIVHVIRAPQLRGELGPDPRSGYSTTVHGRMSDGNAINLYFHPMGGPDVPDADLIGLTQVQALALVEARGLTHWS